MSDQKTTAGDGIHQNHWCEHENCRKWGSFGFARTKADKPRWWCDEHYPYWDTVKVVTPA